MAKICLQRALIYVGVRPAGEIWSMETDQMTDLAIPNFARHINNVVLAQTREEMVKLQRIKAALYAEFHKLSQDCPFQPNQPFKTVQQITRELSASDDLNHVNELVEQLVIKSIIKGMASISVCLHEVQKAMGETEGRLKLLMMRNEEKGAKPEEEDEVNNTDVDTEDEINDGEDSFLDD